MPSLEERLSAIEARNAKVTCDKAWETSFVRRAAIALLIYFFAVLFLCVSGIENYWLSALIPAIGYLLSTLTLPLLRQIWQKTSYEKRNQ